MRTFPSLIDEYSLKNTQIYEHSMLALWQKVQRQKVQKLHYVKIKILKKHFKDKTEEFKGFYNKERNVCVNFLRKTRKKKKTLCKARQKHCY